MTHFRTNTLGTFHSEYFVIDDCIDERGNEGFVVMAGDPVSAIGCELFAAKTLRECIAYLLPHITRGETVYRVRLARRHGAHTVSVLLGWTHQPFRDCGMWRARGFDAYGRHFNRAFRAHRGATSFLSKMRRGIEVDRY